MDAVEAREEVNREVGVRVVEVMLGTVEMMAAEVWASAEVEATAVEAQAAALAAVRDTARIPCML